MHLQRAYKRTSRAGKHNRIDIDPVSAECESGSVICKHTAEVITWTNHLRSSCVPLNQAGMWSNLRKRWSDVEGDDCCIQVTWNSPTYELSPQEEAFKCQPPRGNCKWDM